MKTKLAGWLAAGLLVLGLAGCGAKTNEATDTVRWMNGTYAVLTTANEWDVNLFGGLKKNAVNEKIMQQLLKDWWEVTDRQSADENLDWLLEEGHRTGFMQTVNELELKETDRQTYEDIAGQLSESDQIFLSVLYDAAQAYGDNAITAWDYSRAVQCLSAYYIAGYYTEQEALDKSLEISKMIQQAYGSWDDFYQSYLYGYQYWADDDINDPLSDSYARKKLLDDVKALEKGPYQLDWNTELVKTW